MKKTEKQKNNIKSQYSIILLILIGIFLYNTLNSVLNSLMLNFTGLNQESLKSKFSEIHFSSPGNDFGGGIFWLGTNSVKQDIKDGTTPTPKTKTCTKQIKGIYYNAARGSRLRPLDEDTLNILSGSGIGYSNLSMTGGLYTTCDGNTSGEKYSIYGYISYDWSNTKSYIIAGTKLNYNTNGYISNFANSFQYFNNQTPLGYIRDSVGGIGFVGGTISGNQELINYLNTGSINDIFDLSGGNIIYNGEIIEAGTGTAEDTMRNILIQGNVILSKAIDIYEKRAFLGNLGKKTILLNSSDINSSSIINKAKKNAELLCKGKTYFAPPIATPTTLTTNSESVLCYKNINLIIDLANDSTKYKDKTIIMKNGSISLKNSMTGSSPALDIFIDGGNLYIQNIPGNKQNFNNQGYPATTNITNSGILIKGNYIINGLLIGANPSNQFSPTIINHKLHLLGKIVTLNTPTLPNEGRINQIKELLNDEFTTRINLENIFNWQCSLNGISNDGTQCIGESSASTTPFVVLNENFQSKILR